MTKVLEEKLDNILKEFKGISYREAEHLLELIPEYLKRNAVIQDPNLEIIES